MDRVRSHMLDNVTIDDSGTHEPASSNVNIGNNGSFRINFHDDPGSLASWFHRLGGTIKRSRTRHDRQGPRFAERPAATVGPRLNIAIHIVGSRGDVQPFIPIAQLLMKEPYQYRVRICTHPVFKDFVESHGIEFFSIGGDPEALMAYMVRNPGLLPHRGSTKPGEVSQRRKDMWDIVNGAWRGCIEAGNGMGGRIKTAYVRKIDDLFLADAIIANPPSTAHIHCAEKLGIPLHMVFTMPWSPTESFHHPLASTSSKGQDAKTVNYLSFIVMELLTWEGIGDIINKFRRQKLGLDPISPMWGFQLLTRLRVPYSYLWSQSLIPKPADWGSNINITGFSFLHLTHKYTPSPDLAEFLASGPPPIYIGFGSIVVDDPGALTQLIYDAVRIAGVRAVVSSGWGGVGNHEDVPDNVLLIGDCPHDWLFHQVSAVVHHGGAGTTANGIAAGLPTVVVPFFGDQLFWGQMVARAGAGPDPVPFKKMTAETLAESISFCFEPEPQAAAKNMAQIIAREDGAFDTARDFNEKLRVEDFECDVCPGRLATWKHKKTDLHLSGFAFCCLADKGIVQLDDVKLLRHRNWYVDEGAENPLVGATAALTGLIAAIVTATSDYKHALKNRPDESAPSPMPPPMPHHPPPTATTAQDSGGGAPLQRFLSHRGHLRGFIPRNPLSPEDMEARALKMARKSLHISELSATSTKRSPSFYGKKKAAWKAWEGGKHGHSYYVTRLTGRYATELSKAGLKAPVTFFFEVANGFHNDPSYGIAGVKVRRRDQITGFGSGLSAAGKEFVLGMWDAFSGVAVQPYQGAKNGGVLGTGKGIWRGARGFVFNIGAAVFGLPGYTLKGIERECSKRHLTRLKAEVILIRMRQGIGDFRQATPEQREEVIARWTTLT